ncbi:helicase-related protein [Thermoactinomyces vulgaris]|jgi:SNF2 family DNA or RNA helicase|uniref:helicase-related protein n=1 Tax=Thermoactinomyces vulgaris TaxID=2026 RepID=UPI00363DC075
MARLEDITVGAVVKGILPHGTVKILTVQWMGLDAVVITYKDNLGHVEQEILYRDRETTLEVIAKERPWSFDGDGSLFRLVSEARRIQLAHLFDPHLAVHTSIIEPLPHQITAVYGEMLTRQPLRYLLADDPGAGKTIMAGLLIKELMLRGDLHHCLIVCPGSLADQWQDELYRRFQLNFELLTNDRIEAARTRNIFREMPLMIARLDKLSRNEELLVKLSQTDWDLIVVDEAHKMSASFFNGEIKETKRYKLGKLLSKITRHFLLMTATPHNGKEEDFQLFMALLDGDRFEGRFRDGVHVTDTSDLMRRLVKEQLVTFENTPLFPERRAYTVTYNLSEEEAVLYKEVTNYVREEFNRAEKLENNGRKGTVGFALTILQRRLASSPEAIYQSLKRRRERLEKRAREEELLKRGSKAKFSRNMTFPLINDDDLEDMEDTLGIELEELEEEVVDQATAARTLAELYAEIATLKRLEALALKVKRSGKDVKWQELRKLLLDNSEMFDSKGGRRKLIIFTEHRDTLRYLADRIRTLLGKPEAVVTIQGGVGREERRKVQEKFTQDKEVQILIATDAAGEGINLQRAHLMVNYDLPWNPNRLEQRFGRIHRIGQTEVCHLWNLVAKETREGEVYRTLLKKLEAERKALGGGVFDVLGKAIAGKELRSLLIEAIRYGDRSDVKERLKRAVETKLDRERLKALLEDRALARDSMDSAKVREIKEEMERAEARRLQPHFIASFFLKAFELLGGVIRERESQRYEIIRVPVAIRNRDRLIGIGEPVLPKYERVCFDKELINIPGKPTAAFICPGHPLLDATLDLILERYRGLLKQGAILVDDNDFSDEPRVLFYLEHTIKDGRTAPNGERRVVSRRMQFVEIDAAGNVRPSGYAPYLDYRPLKEDEQTYVQSLLDAEWLKGDLESKVLDYVAAGLAHQHLNEVRKRKEELVKKTRQAVWERLTKEIIYWDSRAMQLQEQELAGKPNAKINSAKARKRRDELEARLKNRIEELDQELHLSNQMPIVIGGALIVPKGLLEKIRGDRQDQQQRFAKETKRVEQIAMEAVMEAERSLGYEPRDVSAMKLGYDIESRIPETGQLRFIEVKGRIDGANTVTVTKNEILTALNKPDQYFLSLVRIFGDRSQASPREIRELEGSYLTKKKNCDIRYVRRPFTEKPDFAATSVNYDWNKLWKQGVEPDDTAKKETD